MSKVCVVTDSTADLPAGIRRELGIEMVPLNVHFGDEVFKDAVEMDSDRFWAHLARSPHHPKTSQPAPGDFLEVYRRIQAEGRPIVSVHISSALSGTLNSAQIAREMLGAGAQVELVDTRSASLGVGMLAIEAARMAQAGAGAAEIAARVREIAARLYIYFGVDTLEFLHRNGRIGKAQALLGGLLNVKPILTIQDGVVGPADKVRGKNKVLPRVQELMAERVPAGRRVKLAVVHANDVAEARRWLEAFQGQYQVVESHVGSLGAVIATHVGPGTVGVVLYEV